MEQKQGLMSGDYLSSSSIPTSPGGAIARRKAKAEKNMASLKARWQLWIAMIFCFVFMIAEVVGGYFAGSLAIMTE